MNRKSSLALGVLVIVIAGVWFASGSSLKGSFMPSGSSSRESRSATPAPVSRGYSNEPGYSSEPKILSGEAPSIKGQVTRTAR